MSLRSAVIQAYMMGKAGLPIGGLLDKLEHKTDENVWREIASLKREVAALRREVEASRPPKVVAIGKGEGK
jgi:hypothetical protein